jgi:hypothetical protein
VYTRGYLRDFDWEYGPEGVAPPPTPPGELPGGAGGMILVPVFWDGLAINAGNQPDGLTVVVTNLTGWLDTPPMYGNDADRTLADGAVWGPKIIGARQLTVEGAAVGPRPLLGALRDQLARRAAARLPADFAVTDGGNNRTLIASVRCDADSYRQEWITPTAYRFQFALTCADPLLYDAAWQELTLNNLAGEETGRTYNPPYAGWWPPPDPPGSVGPGPPFTEPPGWLEEVDGPWYPPDPPKNVGEGESRGYPNWRYRSPWTSNTAVVTNLGNADAPLFALYRGDLTESILTDDFGGIVRVAEVPLGMELTVGTSTLTAEAIGGMSRASFIQPGSRPIVLQPGSTRIHLYAAGRGSVTLAWRSAWV